MAGPRLTVGIQGCKWGLLGRYWNGSTSGSGFTPALPGSPFNGLVAFDVFRAYTIDMEVQRRFVGCKWQWYAFTGVRYATLNNDRTLNISNSFGGDCVTAHPASPASNSTVPALLLACGALGRSTNVLLRSLFYANRYSFLGGNGGVSTQTSAGAGGGGVSSTTTNGASARGRGDMLIGAVRSWGIQWNAKLQCLPGPPFPYGRGVSILGYERRYFCQRQLDRVYQSIFW